MVPRLWLLPLVGGQPSWSRTWSHPLAALPRDKEADMLLLSSDGNSDDAVDNGDCWPTYRTLVSTMAYPPGPICYYLADAVDLFLYVSPKH
jgi:hypothetical protein